VTTFSTVSRRRYNIGVQDQQAYVIKRVDEDFFDEN
jgi:hypothetical protein